MRNLANFLVHLFGRSSENPVSYLTAVHNCCLLCEEPIGDSPVYLTYKVCPYCRFHYTLSARERIELLADRGTFKESHKYLSSMNPLAFSRRNSYRKLLDQDQSRTGLTEAAVTGRCRIGGVDVETVTLDFGFMGGSMGSVVGEKVALALEAAVERRLPLVAIVTGGGVRLQEGVLSLMQMAKTVAAATRLREEGLPFVVILANPSTGQAYASFANLADVILAEPGALVGLSPLRTLRELAQAPLPLDAHTAESHLEHGLLDDVVDREVMTQHLGALLNMLTGQKHNKAEKNGLVRPELNLSAPPEPWDAVLAARQAERPQSLAYMRLMLQSFLELHGDRRHRDDRSVVGGLGYLHGEPVVCVGQQRRALLEGGRYHVNPDGLRKAQRLIRMATRFKLPLVTLVDTQGADPSLEAEEQGIGNAIAETLALLSDAPVPIVSAIIGEGGSEGALTLGVADRVLMQQYAIYSPISLNNTLGGPYPNSALDREAAEALMLTAQDCLELGIVDQLAPEPSGGSHNDPKAAAQALEAAIFRHLQELGKLSTSKLLKRRYDKFRRMGERSPHSQEAMKREVELLMRISAAARHRSRAAARGARKSAEEEPLEAQPSATD